MFSLIATLDLGTISAQKMDSIHIRDTVGTLLRFTFWNTLGHLISPGGVHT